MAFTRQRDQTFILATLGKGNGEREGEGGRGRGRRSAGEREKGGKREFELCSVEVMSCAA